MTGNKNQAYTVKSKVYIHLSESKQFWLFYQVWSLLLGKIINIFPILQGVSQLLTLTVR